MSDAKMVITGVSNKASRENCLTIGPINGLPTDFCSFLIFKLLHFLNNVFTVSELRLYFYLCGSGSTFLFMAPALLFSLWLRLYFSLCGSGSTFLYVAPATAPAPAPAADPVAALHCHLKNTTHFLRLHLRVLYIQYKYNTKRNIS